MRFMLTFRIPTDEGNAAAKDGRLAQTVQSIMEELRPEAAYFADIRRLTRRTYLVVNMDDASQIPAMAKPLFLGLGATVKLYPVMTTKADLQRGIPALEQAVQKYG
jgi:hypothetical protein